MISRDRKILRISQAHLAPGMSLDRWREIMRRHSVPLTDKAGVREHVSDEMIEAIWSEIAGIVQPGRLKNTNAPVSVGGGGARSIAPANRGFFHPAETPP